MIFNYFTVIDLSDIINALSLLCVKLNNCESAEKFLINDNSNNLLNSNVNDHLKIFCLKLLFKNLNKLI